MYLTCILLLAKDKKIRPQVSETTGANFRLRRKKGAAAFAEVLEYLRFWNFALRAQTALSEPEASLQFVSAFLAKLQGLRYS